MWRLDADRALVATVDVITPLVDDARTWGRITAANAASDVYAMGARPLFALNIVGWNAAELPTELLSEVLAGAAEVAAEGGFVIAGGHTIDDPEPKYGLAVVGEAHPDRLLTADGLTAGEDLVLTKPLGTGVLSTAIKAGLADEDLVAAGMASMTRLNAAAAEAAHAAGARGATDVTGFGLLGHLRELVEASDVAAELDVAAVPILEGVAALAADGVMPGGSRRNLAWAGEILEPGDADATTQLLLADAQTSGGLLFGVSPPAAAQAVATLRASGHTAAVVGRVTAGPPRITLR